MITIPLQVLPNQEFSVVLDGQNCIIAVRRIGMRCFLSLKANDVEVCSEHLCANAEPIPVWETNRFKGKLLFLDSIGQEHPDFEGFGDRFKLKYLTEEEWRELMP